MACVLNPIIICYYVCSLLYLELSILLFCFIYQTHICPTTWRLGDVTYNTAILFRYYGSRASLLPPVRVPRLLLQLLWRSDDANGHASDCVNCLVTVQQTVHRHGDPTFCQPSLFGNYVLLLVLSVIEEFHVYGQIAFANSQISECEVQKLARNFALSQNYC